MKQLFLCQNNILGEKKSEDDKETSCKEGNETHTQEDFYHDVYGKTERLTP